MKNIVLINKIKIMRKYLIIVFLMIVTTSSFGAYYCERANLYGIGMRERVGFIELPSNYYFLVTCDAYSSCVNNLAVSEVLVYDNNQQGIPFFNLINDSRFGSMTIRKSGITHFNGAIAKVYVYCETTVPGYATAEAYIKW